MPQITAIKLQKRDTAHCNIYIDKQFSFVLSSLDVSALGLKVGLEIDGAEVDRLSNLAEATRTRRLALNYLSLRARSRKELEQYLIRKGSDVEEIPGVLDRLEESGLLNDLKFAEMWVADRMALKPRSQRQLEQELSAKGVRRDLIAQVLSTVSTDEQSALLVRLIAKKRRIGAQDEQKLLQYLLRQGFGYAEVREALKEFDTETM